MARLAFMTIALAAALRDAPREEDLRKIVSESGVRGGVVLHVGCAGAEQAASLRPDDRFLVQGLALDRASVDPIRKALLGKGLGGTVTVREFDGTRLPCADSLVNLIVVSAACGVTADECRRVLAPRGVVAVGPGTLEAGPFQDGRWKAVAGGAGGYRLFAKPVPPELDEWTHYQHDPQGTMVGRDTVVGPPRGIQWVGDPKWLRNHDFMSSMNAMVSADGRIFYVIDEGLRNHIFLPARWALVARDGFNGVILWKRPLKDWWPNNWPLKSGPGHLPRRLVAVEDRVYVAGGLAEPVKALDAATGETVRTYEGTRPTEEILLADGVLYLLVDPKRPPVDYRAEGTSYKEIGRASGGWAWTAEQPERDLRAVEAATGKILWQHAAKVAPLSLTVGGDWVFFHNGTGVVALDRKTGQPRWTSSGPGVGKVGTGGALRGVYADGAFLFADGTALSAFDAKDGKPLWNGKLMKTSHHCPEDVFVIDGAVWSAHTGTPQKQGTHFKVMDLRTGEVRKDFVAENLPAFPMHPRCYPGRATTSYLITNGMGAEFYRVGDSKVEIFNYVRGSCVYGVMPCNGLLYKPADSCACYYQSKLEYFCALAPARAPAAVLPEAGRLEKGPAYGQVEAIPESDADWPMHRRDAARSGFCPSPVPAAVKQAWTVEVGERLTQPVVAGGKVLVASKDRQAVHALDAATGKPAWTFVVGGRIDSAPTIHKGAVFFGSADGWVTCLRLADGALAWRYRVAPADRQIVSCRQLESSWPVHGSVLIVKDVLYALAGRNLFFDGGMRLVRLDPGTGKLLSEKTLDEKDPATGKHLQTLIQHKVMPVANADIFSSDGERLYMQEQNFDLEGNRIGIDPSAPPGGRHLFCQTGLLDDLWFHRSYWIYGNDCGEGWGAYAGTRKSNPCGRIMVLDGSRAYAFRSEPLGNMLHPRQIYRLYACGRDPAAAAEGEKPKRKKGKDPEAEADGFITGHPICWQIESPALLVNAMALGGKTLFVAGPPDLADETKMLGYLPGADDAINRQLLEQEAAWQGRRGGLMWAVSAETGKKLAEYPLEAIPVFDGMAAAGGRVYVSLQDGRLACWE